MKDLAAEGMCLAQMSSYLTQKMGRKQFGVQVFLGKIWGLKFLLRAGQQHKKMRFDKFLKNPCVADIREGNQGTTLDYS